MKVVNEEENNKKPQLYQDMTDYGEHQVAKESQEEKYLTVPLSDDNLYDDEILLNPDFIKKLNRSIAQVERGEVIEVSLEDLKSFLGF